MKKDITYVEPGTPEYAAFMAQWDEEYGCLKKKADALRKLGVPPPPRPKPEGHENPHGVRVPLSDSSLLPHAHCPHHHPGSRLVPSVNQAPG